MRFVCTGRPRWTYRHCGRRSPRGIRTRSFGCTPGRLPLRWIYGGGLRHPLLALTYDLSLGVLFGDVKRRAHDHDHLHYLSQLERLRDDSGIVSVHHALKQRRQGWLSSGCVPPPPRLCFLFKVHQSVHDVLARHETHVGHACNRREENVEQEEREHASWTKVLFHSVPPRAHPVLEPHACSHTIMELTNLCKI